MKSSGNLPGTLSSLFYLFWLQNLFSKILLSGCTNGRITYTVDTNLNPTLKISVFRITEAISCDECAHLCHTHYFCRSAGFEPNNKVESGGLCYLSYKESRSCDAAKVPSERVTDFQTSEPVWIDCDVCTDPLQSIVEEAPKIITSVPVVDEDFNKNEVDNDKKEHFTPIPEPEFTQEYNKTSSKHILPFAEILPLPEFSPNRTEEGSGDD